VRLIQHAALNDAAGMGRCKVGRLLGKEPSIHKVMFTTQGCL
jgi:hypothetical protein